jgi:hypothetical protein
VTRWTRTVLLTVAAFILLMSATWALGCWVIQPGGRLTGDSLFASCVGLPFQTSPEPGPTRVFVGAFWLIGVVAAVAGVLWLVRRRSHRSTK